MIFDIILLLMVLVDMIYTTQELGKSIDRRRRMFNIILFICQLITISVIIASIVIGKRGI